MDGPMTIQDDVTASREDLQEIERRMALIQARMAEHDEPFDDEKHNKQFHRLRDQWGKRLAGVQTWHAKAERFLSSSAPTVNFGGPK